MALSAGSVEQEGRRVILGKINGIYGTAGRVRVYSYTRPKENILAYSSWLIGSRDEWDELQLSSGEVHGGRIIAGLGGIRDRDAARALIGRQVAVYRRQLPALPAGEYYFCDLIGLQAINRDHQLLGRVTEVLETGANDVLVVSGERRHLIPAILDHYLLDVDLQRGCIRVDWDVEN